MSKIKIDNQFELLREGAGVELSIQNICKKCGWKGQKHYTYSNFQHSNCKEERQRHQESCK